MLGIIINKISFSFINNQNICFSTKIVWKNTFYASTYRKRVIISEPEPEIEEEHSQQYGIIKILYNHVIYYPTPANLGYFWNFGFLSLFCLVNQIITGVFLAMHYVPNTLFAFSSVEHIMRDINFGWLIRYAHSNGASAFFAVVYIHIFRGLLFKSYSFSNKSIWFSGIIIFILMMATAFVGYVLPWGQMSFWGATVITNLFSVIPLIGTDLVYWLWGGFSVGPSTLTRFFSFHYLLPFIIFTFVIIHIFYLHNIGSSNPFPLEHKEVNTYYITFYPYFFIKDAIGFFIFLVIFFYFIFFHPNLLGHSDNYIEANSLVTPEHIVPEWYFLPFYAILRSIPNKEQGIIAMAFSLVIFFFIPIFELFFNSINITNESIKNIKKNYFFWIYKYSFRYFITLVYATVFICLGVLGSRPVEYPYIEIGNFLTKLYFINICFISFISNTQWEYEHNHVVPYETEVQQRIGNIETENTLKWTFNQ